ncbi:chemotaxis protein CheD [Pseudomonas corrugata]|uniref:chemotaxis protein CheD n=1 Tax=Pseudomonas corrugata TaxID=47879 RepID=UPI001586DDC1|nr:chemotaxis protein CheD [Pseudomonas corrugata]MCI0994667.1 chemotaxis protein CheD [Pseudomonas corrugata]NUT66031.1 chemotaxis protein CheD [Pseudomonas corrugata]
MARVIEYFLQPGDVAFGGRQMRLCTVLGSCVALVFWHPQRLLGGMCHYMLPRRGRRDVGSLNGRYAVDALALLFECIHRTGARPDQFEVSLFGGADMFPGVKRCNDIGIGQQNIDAARSLIQAHGLQCRVYHVGGRGHRHLVFDVGTGRLQLHHGDSALKVFESPKRHA